MKKGGLSFDRPLFCLMDMPDGYLLIQIDSLIRILIQIFFQLLRGQMGTHLLEIGRSTHGHELQMCIRDRYPAAVNSYINDHAAFRNLFLSMNSIINLKLFGYADSQDVIEMCIRDSP